MLRPTSAVFLLCAVSMVVCDHLIVGDTNQKRLIHHKVVQYNAIPLFKREKQYFYHDPQQQVIQSMLIYDNLNSKATVEVTAGGVGHSFVNLRFNSERGVGLDYDVGIYGDFTGVQNVNQSPRI